MEKDPKKVHELFNIIYPRLRESDFINIYLPLLMDNESSEGRARWISEVSKKPGMRVIVCEDNDRSASLFWVPPVVNPVETVRHHGFEKVAMEYNRTASKFNEAVAEITFRKELEGVVKSDKTPPEFIEQWEYILKRYNYIPDKEEQSADVPVAKDDDFEANW